MNGPFSIAMLVYKRVHILFHISLNWSLHVPGHLDGIKEIGTYQFDGTCKSMVSHRCLLESMFP